LVTFRQCQISFNLNVNHLLLMKVKKLIFGHILIFFLTFSSCIYLVFAGFQLGDSSLPIDEEGFIDYDWEDKLASQSYKLKVEFIKLYQYEEIIRALGVNISVSKYDSNSSSYEVLNVDTLEFQNQLCLLYNRTDQYFKFGDKMNNLLIHGYGGYYIIPDDPVNVNIVKLFIESYTAWSANVTENTITIEIGNDQAILTYSEKGVLIKEEIKNNNEIVSTLTIINPNDDKDNLIFTISIIATTIATASLLIPIVIIIIKKRQK
ncbi:MAG: hypothetical protein ACFE8B_04455, partial [Candidatus Hermodarchaeota archaeon]